MTGCRARLAGLGVHLPARWRSSEETEEKIARMSGARISFRPGFLARATGVRGVHVMEDDQESSDLAVIAARQALTESATAPGDVDLMLFAATGQDLLEPATAHVVAAKLGLDCPVFDVKNACNSVLNALEVAAAFITVGAYRTILVTCGEASSRAVRWTLPAQRALNRSLAGYTCSDAGAALVLTAGPDGPQDAGVLRTVFRADSTAWPLATVGGGSRWRREKSSADDDEWYFQADSRALYDACRRLVRRTAPGILAVMLAEDWLSRPGWSAFALVGVHQVSSPYREEVHRTLGIPEHLALSTIAEHGNLAAATLPLQLARARALGRVRQGDLVALIGVGSGMSLGVAVLRL